MVDIHTHILPGVDDGAPNPEESVRLLRAELADGIHRLYLTPHFDCRRQSAEEFLQRRSEAFAVLTDALKGTSVPQMRLGAEVRYTPDLLELDLHRLTLGGSVYLLLELPDVVYPTFVEQVVEKMLERQIVPILAHVERCRYFRHRPAILKDLIDRGALAQVSADVVMTKPSRSFSMACLRHGLAHFVASDAHNVAKRPPCLGRAVSVLLPKKQEQLAQYADAVWQDADILPERCTVPARFFCKHR